MSRIFLKIAVCAAGFASSPLVATDAAGLGRDFATHFMRGISVIANNDEIQIASSQKALTACVADAMQLAAEQQKLEFCRAALKALENESIHGLAGAFIDAKNGHIRSDLIILLTIARVKNYIKELLKEIVTTGNASCMCVAANQSEKALFSFVEETEEEGYRILRAYFRAGLRTLHEGGFPCCESEYDLVNMPPDWQELLRQYFFPMPFDDRCRARVGHFLFKSRVFSDW